MFIRNKPTNLLQMSCELTLSSKIMNRFERVNGKFEDVPRLNEQTLRV